MFEGSYDPAQNMRCFWSLGAVDTGSTMGALSDAHRNKDRSQVPVILDMMRLIGAPTFREPADFALRGITGWEFSGSQDDLNSWTEWVGNRLNDCRPPPGYIQWKAELLGGIDPRIKNFLLSAQIASRIDLTEVVWGGVRTDGIPDLQNVPVIEALEADYLNPSDRVFGVSINGEHRAYPLRIINTHEMANDVLGGEPIALAY